LLQELQAQAGKHIATTCTDSNGQTFNPVDVLIADIQALLASLGTAVKPMVIVGSVLNSGSTGISGATVSLLGGSKTAVAVATTDAVGFYCFTTTSGLTVGARYSVSVTLPRGFKSSTPSALSVLWSASLVNLNSLVLN
jgi:hypothetical protein